MRIYLMTAIPLVLSTGIAGCGLEKQKLASKRTIPKEYVEGSFIVEASSDDSSKLAAAGKDVGAALGCHAAEPEKINWSSKSSPTSVSSESLEKTYNLRFEGCDFTRDGTESILEKLGAAEGVLNVEAEAVVTATPVNENDRLKSQQTYLKLIERDEGCNLLGDQSGVKPIVVAVIDSGVDKDHTDLQGSFYRDSSGRVIGANFVGSGAAMPSDDQWNDKNGHGTHVAGLVAATSGNREGIAGVAACAPVKIMPIRVLNAEGSGTSVEIERGVKWAIDNGADILNLSLGYTATSYSREEVSRPIYDYAAKRNVIVFAAAGNSSLVNGSASSSGRGYDYGLPGAYKNVVGVAATDNSGRLTGFSNRGDRVDVATPGSKLLSTYPGGYESLSGTSMASPVAAGIYALALSAARAGEIGESATGRLSFEDASDLMASSSVKNVSISKSDVQSGGVLDAKILVAATVVRFGRRTDPVSQPVQPVAPANPITPGGPVAPDLPAVVVPQPAALEFVGLSDGQKLSGATKIGIKNLPAGTKTVYFAWAGSIFSKATISSGSTSVEDQDKWYLWGSDKLTAYAVGANGRVIAKTTLNLRGF